MKIKESGMPDENVWEGFFRADEILKKLGLNDKIADVADFGCGYGTFTIPAAKIIKGKVYAIDIESEMIEITEQKAKVENLGNIELVLRDFVSKGSDLEDESVDYIILANILHVEEPEKLLRETYRVLRQEGKIVIIHWNYDPTTPRGPPLEIRPTPEKCIDWAKSSGFKSPLTYDLKPYHYGIVLSKGKM
ncbi:class I SAM-dependent methyltransferase [Methanohalophilus halophilus]|uniref:Class I SAM-dependent methyltransferase n=1 Tax=Methanohalophilus halophilus TaxID=2177 RepID=A0A1L3Q0W0_9EURY|nr:class I SAM-dependent methyltransferase [Methanohalophilus halophilus]APH38507.1 methyltransferase type 11 [Methanohalophilus halophilus]RNI10615.1 class I SAM-dependent methyltransferase [Methanohalophilus halophilus]SDW11453.1 Methyltransferase domain-containing protein [Methanohalophilus halophilus]